MDTVRWTGVGSCWNCGWVNGTANTSSLLFWKLPWHRFEKVELGVYAHRGLRWLCSWPWAVPMTAWKQEMLQSGFPLFSSVRAHVCLLPDLLLRGALWDTGVSHLSQRFLGSHDGTPHPYERPLCCAGPKDYAGSETFSVSWGEAGKRDQRWWRVCWCPRLSASDSELQEWLSLGSSESLTHQPCVISLSSNAITSRFRALSLSWIY